MQFKSKRTKGLVDIGPLAIGQRIGTHVECAISHLGVTGNLQGITGIHRHTKKGIARTDSYGLGKGHPIETSLYIGDIQLKEIRLVAVGEAIGRPQRHLLHIARVMAIEGD